MTKDLKEKAINIKGKDYVLVKDRIIYFNETYNNGCIQTKLISSENNTYVICAKVTPDTDKPERCFTGYSQAKIGEGMVNTTAALENAETSAVGRALAMMGIGVIESIASADEMNKATYNNTNAQKIEGSCPKCGAEMKLSKRGTHYCSALCWKKGEQVETAQTNEEIMEDLPF